MPPRVVRSTHRHRRGPRAFTAFSEVSSLQASEVPAEALGMDASRSEAGVQELSWAAFDTHVQALARAILPVFAPEAVVGVAHGGVFVGGALAGALGADFFPVRISRRSRVRRARDGRPRLSGTMPRELKGLRVLLVDDVAASGETLRLAKKLAQKAGARALRTATLVCRPEGFSVDFCALRSDALFVFPWDYEDVREDARFDTLPAPQRRPKVRR
jgi:hypoxanthine phosphoribosyltransferase